MNPKAIPTTFEERHKGIGGSDLSDLLELDEYSCRKKLQYSKCGVPKDYEDNGYALKRGKRLEPIAFSYFKEEFEHEFPTLEAIYSTEINTSFVLEDESHVRVNIDALIRHKESGVIVAPAEFKTLGEDSFKKYKKEGLPQKYIAQLQWAIGILELSHGFFGIYWPDGDELEYFRVDQDPNVFLPIKARATNTWKLIQDGVNFPKKKPLEHEAYPRSCKGCAWRKKCSNIGYNGKPLLEKQSTEVSLEF